MEFEADLYQNYTQEQLIDLLKNQVISATNLTSENLNLESKINKLQFELAQLRRMIFGSKSERFIASQNQEQLTIPFDIDQDQLAEVIALETQQITYEREKTNNQKHLGRLDLPSHLPVNEIILQPLEDVSQMKFIGNEITSTTGSKNRFT